MGRTNKKTQGVFTDIVGTMREISAYDNFIDTSSQDLKSMPTKSDKSKQLSGFIIRYKKLIDKYKNTFEQLAKLEEIILELRSKENIDDVKLSLVRKYIYARTPFFRKFKKAKDIRVLVDNVESWSDNIEQLYKDEKFMTKAKEMLSDVMDKEIKDNIKSLKK